MCELEIYEGSDTYVIGYNLNNKWYKICQFWKTEVPKETVEDLKTYFEECEIL